MKISTRSTALALTGAALLAISACGGSDTPDQKDVPVSTYQKNAALSLTTLPATTAPTMKSTTLVPSGVTAAPTTRPGRKNITINSAKPPT